MWADTQITNWEFSTQMNVDGLQLIGPRDLTRPKAVPEEYRNLGTFRIKRLEFLTQGLSLIWSQTHAYEPGLAGLMLGGMDRSC
jgi:hypothetical protein